MKTFGGEADLDKILNFWASISSQLEHVLKPTRGILSRLGAHLGCFWALFGALGRLLGRSWGKLKSCTGQYNFSGRSWAALGRLLGALWELLGLSWAALGP